MKKFFVYLIIWLVIGAVISLISFFVVSSLLPGILVTLILFLIWLIYKFIKRLIIVRRAKKKVESLTKQEDESSSSFFKIPNFFQKEQLSEEIEEEFVKLQKELNSSSIDAKGNPIYSLPWYAVIGSPELNTNLIQDSNLPGPLFFEDQGFSKLKSDLWLPYHNAILFTPNQNDITDFNLSDHDILRWKTFFQCLLKYRPNEPLNGIVLNLPHELFLNKNETELEELGKRFQAFLHEAMRSVKVKMPVYLFVSGVGNLDGFSEISEILKEQNDQQMLGFSLDAEHQKSESFIRDSFFSLKEKLLKAQLFSLQNNKKSDHLDFGFSKTWENLTTKILQSLSVLVTENPFQEVPALRGVYFNSKGNKKEEKSNYFTKDFFTKRLPEDRKIASSVSIKDRAEIASKRSFFAWWFVVVFSLFSFLITSFVSHRGYLNEMIQENSGLFTEKTTFAESLTTLHNLGIFITTLEEETNSWLIPWFSPFGEPDFISKLKRIYTDRFESQLFKQVNSGMLENLNQFDLRELRKKDEKEAVQILAKRINSFVRRIIVLQAYFDENSRDEVDSLPASFEENGLYFDKGVDPEILEMFNNTYVQYLLWPKNNTMLADDLEFVEGLLFEQLDESDKNLSWIIELANLQVKADSQLSTIAFWPGTSIVEEYYSVPPAFTVRGKEFIDEFTSLLSKSLSGKKRIEEKLENFRSYYSNRYFKAWSNYASKMNEGEKTLANKDEWITAIDFIGSAKNPYFKALEVMNTELKPFEKSERLPDWVQLIFFYNEMKLFDPNGSDNSKQNKVLTKMGLKLISKLGPLGKAIAKAGKKGAKTQKKLAGKPGKDERAEAIAEAGKILGDYRTALSNLAFNTNARAISFKSMQEYFANPTQPGAGSGPDAAGEKAIYALERLIGKESRDNRVFWQIYKASLVTSRKFLIQEAACHLQKKWENQFLVEIDGVPKYKLGGLVFAEGGMLWTFLENEASPFMKKVYRKGYVANRVNDFKIDFNRKFVRFVAVGWDTLKQRNVEKIRLSFPQKITNCWDS